MEAQHAGTDRYVVPTYRAPVGAGVYHFLHGNVPGHQIDFIYRPEVPQGPLTQQHFSHLSRLVTYIEPRNRRVFAFAIGNLSRDDTQYEPGRGGIALIFGLRIRGAKDHAGRQDPPFCHALAAIGRHVDETALWQTSIALYRKLLPDDRSQAEGSGFYHRYVQSAGHREAVMPLLHAYLEAFDDLPALPPSALGFRWTVEGATPPKRILIAYGDHDPFEAIAAAAARIAGVLVESDIRWTVISTGREGDVQGGVSIRFVSHSEAGPEGPQAHVFPMHDLPGDPKQLAELLFGAKEVAVAEAPKQPLGWRQLYGETGDAGSEEQARAEPEQEAVESTPCSATQMTASTRQGSSKNPPAPIGWLVGAGVVLAIGGAVAAMATSAGEPPGAAAPITTAEPLDRSKAIGSMEPARPVAAPAVPTAAAPQAPSATIPDNPATDERIDAGAASDAETQVEPPAATPPVKALPSRPPKRPSRPPPPPRPLPFTLE